MSGTLTTKDQQIVDEIKTQVFNHIADYFVFKPPKIDNVVVYTRGHKGFAVIETMTVNSILQQVELGDITSEEAQIIITDLSRYNLLSKRTDATKDFHPKISPENETKILGAFNNYVGMLVSFVRKNAGKRLSKPHKARSAAVKLKEAKALLDLFGVGYE